MLKHVPFIILNLSIYLGPDGAPQNVRGHSTSSTSIQVLWDEVLPEQQNGVITGYTVTYKAQAGNQSDNISISPSNRQVEIADLKKFANYNVTVFASTAKGDGPRSVLVVKTGQDSK